MATTTIEYDRRLPRTRVGTAPHLGHFGLATMAGVLFLISAWGGIIPFVGPIFGYSADGTGSWHWSLAHSVLALVPGAIGLAIALALLAGARGVVIGRRRISLALAGFVTVACGAWFVIGPLAWSVVYGARAYFVAASPLRTLAYHIGYAWGPGLIMAGCGAFFLGWASRHQRKATIALVGEEPLAGGDSIAVPVRLPSDVAPRGGTPGGVVAATAAPDGVAADQSSPPA